ncbi:hypothetical protein L227DRAFT_371400 [Lentinus tigrinus ALCF2SS1-6]|uniref:Uncharacterized protein n=1 Tax=Lentinus tigrinus ALCF2SS1-6 TaxID=1328759 RepID=A0A5C2RU43_9APHY|nr:hypothetical protein L227DRAFT_371400 [Lentinus tigrinus ALCF2SS1-6]
MLQTVGTPQGTRVTTSCECLSNLGVDCESATAGSGTNLNQILTAWNQEPHTLMGNDASCRRREPGTATSSRDSSPSSTMKPFALLVLQLVTSVSAAAALAHATRSSRSTMPDPALVASSRPSPSALTARVSTSSSCAMQLQSTQAT